MYAGTFDTMYNIILVLVQNTEQLITEICDCSNVLTYIYDMQGVGRCEVYI